MCGDELLRFDKIAVVNGGLCSSHVDGWFPLASSAIGQLTSESKPTHHFHPFPKVILDILCGR
jgi:hypothetical protein